MSEEKARTNKIAEDWPHATNAERRKADNRAKSRRRYWRCAIALKVGLLLKQLKQTNGLGDNQPQYETLIAAPREARCLHQFEG